MKFTIYRDEKTELWIRYKYRVEADSVKEAIKVIKKDPTDYINFEEMYERGDVSDIEYLDENYNIIHES